MAACRKQRFATLDEAEAALLNIRLQQVFHRSQKRRERRVYVCRLCRGFHLTSKPGWRDRAA